LGCCRSVRNGTRDKEAEPLPAPSDHVDRRSLSELRSGLLTKEKDAEPRLTWWQEEILRDRRDAEVEVEERERRRRFAKQAFQEERKRRLREAMECQIVEEDERRSSREAAERAERDERERRLMESRRDLIAAALERSEQRNQATEASLVEREDRIQRGDRDHPEAETKRREVHGALREVLRRRGKWDDTAQTEPRERSSRSLVPPAPQTATREATTVRPVDDWYGVFKGGPDEAEVKSSPEDNITAHLNDAVPLSVLDEQFAQEYRSLTTQFRQEAAEIRRQLGLSNAELDHRRHSHKEFVAKKLADLNGVAARHSA